MRKLLKQAIVIGLVLFQGNSSFSQGRDKEVQKDMQLKPGDKGYVDPVAGKGGMFVPVSKKEPLDYVTVPNDPLNARIYTLSNGLQVYMSVYKDVPRIYTAIAVKAGSKTDPSDATGLAHYLEHMLFKGTDQYGTKDYSKEKPELDKIENLFEVYRATKDSVKRKEIYHQIDSISGIAAKYAIANEYDKMVSAIGAKGTNAFTSVEQTVYINDIPSNAMEKWMTIEAERFRSPVLRIFHTELEAVYEEKNRGLDDDGDKIFETLYAELFKKHTYGTQTTIGTIEHLKNPSIVRIKEYLAKYYVPNNMAICIAGDFDPDATIKMIEEKFGKMQSKPLTAFIPPVETPIAQPIEKTVMGPDAESVTIGFRFGGANTPDADLITMVDQILNNGTAGLFDLDLNQNQKVLEASSSYDIMKDYSVVMLTGKPREGQSLSEVKTLMLAELEKIKKGEFPDWMLKAIVNNLKLQQIKSYTRNASRTFAFVNAAVHGVDWKNEVNRLNRFSAITKQQVMDFVKNNYNQNYVVINKKTGEDNTVQKVVKPAITPVETNRDSRSPFVQMILDKKSDDIQPVFIDYKNDIKTAALKNGINISYMQNGENKLFDLYYLVEMGTDNDKRIGEALDYLQYLGTSKYTPAQVKEELFKMGCSFDVFNSDDRVYVRLSGLADNFATGVSFFESLLADVQPNAPAWQNQIQDILKSRADAKLNKQTILFTAMASYAQFGARNPFTNILSEAELKAMKPDELVGIIKNLTSYPHHILYYGPQSVEEIKTSLDNLHKIPATLKAIPPAVKFEQHNNDKNEVYLVNYDMKQAEIMMFSKGAPFDKNLVPDIQAYNQYFGGDMSSVVFQDLRESKALAYSVFSGYQTTSRLDRNNINMAYIGAQADKLPEAMKGMMDLLSNMPMVDKNFGQAKDAIMKRIQTDRTKKSDVLMRYEAAKKLGLDYDVRKDVYDRIQTMTLNDVNTFQNKYVKNNKYTIVVLGDTKKLDLNTLGKYGEVKTLSLSDVFGY